MFARRGIPIDQFGPRLSFFLDCGLDAEYIALARVSRRIWAIGMREVFGAGPKAQLLKLHTQTSGRSLIAAEFKNNLTRTAAELVLAYIQTARTNRSPRPAKNGFGLPHTGRRSCSRSRAFSNTP
jgi:methylmalonyl-CoA mutase